MGSELLRARIMLRPLHHVFAYMFAAMGMVLGVYLAFALYESSFLPDTAWVYNTGSFCVVMTFFVVPLFVLFQLSGLALASGLLALMNRLTGN